jgi:two-component system response regulator NreC
MLLNSHDDIDVVGDACNCHDTLQRVQELVPDVLVLDLSMPGGGGVPLIEKVRISSPGTRIVVLTMHDDPVLVRAAFAAGALGFLAKTAADNELVAAVRAVFRGRAFVNLDLPPAKVQHLLGNKPSDGKASNCDPLSCLSQRESEVFLFLAEGHTNQEIAHRIEVSVKTVDSRIGEKLGLHSRADYVRFAVETGLIAPGKFAG